MGIEPSADCLRKGYGYATSIDDIPHWWHSLTAADQGAWVAGLGAFAAALAAVGVVLFSQRVAQKEKRARARLVAAYFYMPITQVYAALEVIRDEGKKFAAAMPGSASRQVTGSATLMDTACKQTRAKLNVFNLADAAALPGEIGECLATGLMEAEFLFSDVEVTVKSFLNTGSMSDSDADAHRHRVASTNGNLHKMAVHAADKINSFLSFCKETFGIDDLK